MLNQNQISEIFSILAVTIETPKTELNYTNNFTLLLAVVLSSQAKDVSVNLATQKLFQIIQEPQDIIKLGEIELIKHIKSIGLYKNKAKHIMLLAQNLISNFNSQVPEDFDQLVSLPGVGRKTANVVLNEAFGHETIGVDTHVFRVSKRLGLSEANTVEGVESDLLQKVPKFHKYKAHHLLILHGRYICKMRKPQCEICKISHLCKFYLNELIR
ncbi:Endonuclease III [Candidatus Hepatincolaceae symbiont of Richtersius coronifer]